jgi:hypothetical protein
LLDHTRKSIYDACTVTVDAYFDLLHNRLERNFEIARNARPIDDPVDILARFRQDLGRTFISRKDIIDKFWEEEIIIARRLPRVGAIDVSRAESMIAEAAEKLVYPDSEHRLSVITAVLATDGGIDPDAARRASRYRWSRSYMFYFRGFAEGRIAVVDCASHELVLSPRAKGSSRAFDSRPVSSS